ncbi:DUF1572 family protein [Croceivirga thetidis]|uniref:DUF1572 family protein n=1 Tax=Croceivirga thetidis TaxID=2721623 RepID=A0ABX1GS90_9FLAO|nr:DUF1572 family protein [Croceivirga thetidis]NKI31900.1 DUF1572 family protein [Croceivirga thetidis]
MNFVENYLLNVRFEFERYKEYGDKTFIQLNQKQLHWQSSHNDNSIALIVKHMVGNMLSRWTNFLTEDGEKQWRNRDAEFDAAPKTKAEILNLWEEGWNCLFKALDQLNQNNFDSIIKIRGQKHTVIEAINRQLAHYSSHVGQIVLLGKLQKGEHWNSLTINKGESKQFNSEMFGKNS